MNSAGQYLNGWSVNSTTGVANQNALVPIQVNQSTYNPVATQNVTLAANLPATPTTGTATTASPLSSQITVYDLAGDRPYRHAELDTGGERQWDRLYQTNGMFRSKCRMPRQRSATEQHSNYTNAGQATVTFAQRLAAQFRHRALSIRSPRSHRRSPGHRRPRRTVTADASPLGSPLGTPITTTSTATAANGDTIVTDTSDDGQQTTTTVTTTTPGAGTLTGGGAYNAAATNQSAASLSLTTNFGSGNQTINLNLGTYGGTTGVTQFAGTAYSLLGLTQDGVPPGSFSGVTTQANGNVVVNYNNGQTRTIAQIPLVTFNAPDCAAKPERTVLHRHPGAVVRRWPWRQAPTAPGIW